MNRGLSTLAKAAVVFAPLVTLPAFCQNQSVYYPSATNITLQSAAALKIRLGEPVVIAVASRPEKWGFFQFPQLARWQDGRICATWHLAEDSITAYGKGASGKAISSDGGKTWKEPAGPDGVSGLLLPNGDRLRVVTPKAVKTSELQLPEPVGQSVDTYGNVKQVLYRHSELPPRVRGVCLSRLPKGKTDWVPERAALNDPQALRYSLYDLVPIVWWGDMRVVRDKSLIAGIYPGFMLKADGTADPKQNVFFYRSADSGRTWDIQGRILYQPNLAADPRGAQRMGYTEPAYEILKDGTFICVMRTTDGLGDGPMYMARSRDMGKTWSCPEILAPTGVLPRLLRFDNGVLVLSSGRPGVQLRFSSDPAGARWTRPVEMLFCDGGKTVPSCGYTELLSTGPNRFLIIYSDFQFRTSSGEIRKAIKVREVSVSPADVAADRLVSPKWR